MPLRKSFKNLHLRTRSHKKGIEPLINLLCITSVTLTTDYDGHEHAE